MQKILQGEYTDTKILIDYFCFTVTLSQLFPTVEDERDSKLHPHEVPRMIEQTFQLSGLEFQGRKAFYGYTDAAWYNGIVYCWGGQQTIYVQMSGTGCRTFEDHNPDLRWDDWIAKLQSRFSSFHVSRLDVACDTFNLLPMRKMQQMTMQEQFISRWRYYLAQVGNKENSVLWGSPKSDFRLRIYDKTQERRRVAADPSKVPEGWVRCEFQLRNDSAESFASAWLQTRNIGKTFMGILSNQLLYVTQYDGKHRDRATVARWWKKLLGDAEKIPMQYQGGTDYNLEHLQKYVFGQAGASIKTLLAAYDGDVGTMMRQIDASRLNDKQTEFLKTKPAEQYRRRVQTYIEMQEEYKRQIMQ